jgi:hypothetical protein
MGNNLPLPGGKGSHSAAMARRALMGFQQQPQKQLTDEEKKKLRDKRKQERQNKKKARKRR